MGSSVSIDGTDYGTVDTYAPLWSAQQVLFAASGLGAGSHTIEITWAGKNPSASTISYLVVDAIEAEGVPVLVRFEESDPGFVFGSGWWRWSNGGQSGGAAQVIATSGSAASFTFTGSVVRWVGQSGPDRAVASVSIDGGTPVVVDTYAPTYTTQTTLFTASGLAAGTHTIEITRTGANPSAYPVSYLVLDAIEAEGTP